jgi:radical SAM-linked protein
MLRALFEKTGNAIYISHLDLMRLFQRAFKRAGLPLTHTQGFNPRASVSIALPLSVGVESVCELLDFELDGVSVPCEEICLRLNAALIDGIRVREVYENGRKLKELALLRCKVSLEYDKGIPDGAKEALEQLFQRPELVVQKKGKNGIVDQDILPMIRSLSVTESGNCLDLEAVICCQNPSLNPMQLYAAVERYLPELHADFVFCRRLEILDENGMLFT